MLVKQTPFITFSYFPETELAYFDEDEKSILSNFDY